MSALLGISLTVSFVALAFYARREGPLKGLGFTCMVFAVACWALTFPGTLTAWGGFELKKIIVPLVQITLFGMGTTLRFEDFARVLKMPKPIFIGCALSYFIMPLSAALCAYAFGLEKEIAVGLILIGSCPAGVTSNVITYLAKANVPLSVSMTACSTLLAPVMTPLSMKLLAGTYVPIAFSEMFFSIVDMIILPLAVGILVLRYLPKIAAALTRILPWVAMGAVCLIIGITVALSREDLLRVGPVLLAAAFCHNLLGYVLAYQGARLCGLNKTDCRTVTFEVAIHNGGMATGLAFEVLDSVKAAIGAAIYGPWSAITSSALASWWRRRSLGDTSAPEATDTPRGD